MSVSLIPTDVEKATPETRSSTEAAEEQAPYVPLETAVLLSTDEKSILGASTLVADGEIFVVTDETLPVGTEVRVALVLPAREQTVRMKGRVEFLHQADASTGLDQSGIGLSIDADAFDD